MVSEVWLNEVVTAVRSDPIVGRGTCSSVDECLTDDELKVQLRRMHRPGMTVEKAVLEVRKGERIRREYEDDIRKA